MPYYQNTKTKKIIKWTTKRYDQDPNKKEWNLIGHSLREIKQVTPSKKSTRRGKK